jgi:hypothetical protein
MAPKLQPDDGPELWRWYARADRETREANPRYYWFRSHGDHARFFWEEIEVSEEEFRANAGRQVYQLFESG